MPHIFLVSHILLLFHSPKSSWNKSAKYEKLGKYWYCIRNCAITNAYDYLLYYKITSKTRSSVKMQCFFAQMKILKKCRIAYNLLFIMMGVTRWKKMWCLWYNACCIVANLMLIQNCIKPYHINSHSRFLILFSGLISHT